MSQPLIVTAAIILKEDQVLLTRNKNCIYGPDSWGFPAGIGGFKKTSDPYLAVIEEVKGDIGCLFEGNLFMFNYFNIPKLPPTMTLFYIGTIQGEPHPVCHNVLGINYFNLKEADKMRLKYDHNLILNELIQEYYS